MMNLRRNLQVPYIFALELILCIPVFVCAQSGDQETRPPLSRPLPLDKQPFDSDRPVPAERHPRYRISRSDVISLTFPISPEFNQKITVQPDGYINLQGVGSLLVQGMTVPELAEAVKKAYSQTLHDPIVDVDLQDFQRPSFIVSGQVLKPGQYDLRYDVSVSQAIGMAGGFTPTAKTQVFLFHRLSNGWVEVKQLKLKDILRGKNVNEDVQMRAGDMIFVPEKFITNFRKYVPYSFGMYLNPSSFF